MPKLRPLALAFFLCVSTGCSALGPHPQGSPLSTPTSVDTLAPISTFSYGRLTEVVALAQTAGIQPRRTPSPTVTIVRQAHSPIAPIPTFEPSRLRTATPSSGPLFPVTHFESEECAIAFDIPSGWQIEPFEYELYPDASCSLGIRPPGWQAIVEESEALLNDFPILVVTYALPLDAAARLALFVQEDGAWFITGRGMDEAELVQVGGRTILRGVGWYGVYTKAKPSYAGLNTVTRAVLSEDPSFSAVVQFEYMPIDGPITLEEAFELMVRTFRLRERED